MSLPTRIALSIAVACIIGGLALFATSLSMVDGNLAGLGRRTAFEEKTYTVQGAAVSAIALRDTNTAVQMVASPDDQIHLNYVESEWDFYDIDLSSSGTLTIAYRDDRPWFERIFDFSFSRGNATVLAIPAAYLGGVSLSTSNARISASDVDLRGDLTLRTSNGRIQLDGLNLLGQLRITTSNGLVELRRVEADTISTQTNNGAVTATEVRAGAELVLRTSNGRLTVSSITAGRVIELRTSNGRIEGTIDDDMDLFSISSRASNARNNLPENRAGGPKELRVSTSNGRIDLRFLR